MHPPARHSSRLGQRFQVALGAAAALATISLSPGSAQAYVVTVGGVQYDVTTFTGSYDANTSKFALPPAPGVMPWWGNPSLALQFANAVGSSLGTNVQLGQNIYGPWFATSLSPADGTTTNGTRVALSTYLISSSQGVLNGSWSRTQNATWARATTVVPGPLPLFGAAAAFGFSRKLRKRIKLAPNALGSALPQA
jgi:hypothetical protein